MTFSYSTKQDEFLTRYSFEPDCYGYVDNILVSFVDKKTTNTTKSNICHVHNVNESRNTFYDQSYRSEIFVVSNENASKEKVFNSVSAELNRRVDGLFTANIITNADDPNEIQSSSIQQFTWREGSIYAHAGFSSTNSTSNIRFVGQRITPTDSMYVDGSIKVKMAIPISSVVTGENSRIFVQQENQSLAYITSPSTAGQLTFNKQTSYVSSALYISSITGGPYIYDVTIKSANESDPITESNYQLVSSFLGDRTIFSVANPVTSGDDLRGKYALIRLSTNDTPIPFELYAINVDYSQSKMDSSLG